MSKCVPSICIHALHSEGARLPNDPSSGIFPFIILFIIAFLAHTCFFLSFSFWEYSFRNMGGMVRATATVFLCKEFLYSVNGYFNLGYVLSTEFQSFQAQREMKRTLKNIFMLTSKNFLEEFLIYCFTI